MPGQPESTLPALTARMLPAVTAEEEHVLRVVLAAIRQVRHGYVQVCMHEGKVVQIDRLEKERP